MRIRPARCIRGRIRLPGDKSISHRAALIAALANGTSKIRNYATGADCAATVACLKLLGVSIRERDDSIIVTGVGRQGLNPVAEPLDCGNSGSTMRMLAGVLAGQNFCSTLTGDQSLNQRPMSRVIDPLESMGATIHSRSGKPPLTVQGSSALKAISYDLPIASAQVKSSILLAGLNAAGQTSVSEPLTRTRDHTERMLELFGASLTSKAEGERHVITLNGHAQLSPQELEIPGDISSAAYFITAAALLPNSDLVIEDVGLNPTRTEFITFCKSIGVNLDVTGEHEKSNEILGTVHVTYSPLSHRSQSPQRLDGPSIAQFIDELPLIAVLGSQTGGIEIRDAEELRLKESDRISATVKNLKNMGIEVREFDDGMKVSHGRLIGGNIESFGDHRIAMAFTIAALLANGDSHLDDSECVNASFPEFFELLQSIIEL